MWRSARGKWEVPRSLHKKIHWFSENKECLIHLFNNRIIVKFSHESILIKQLCLIRIIFSIWLLITINLRYCCCSICEIPWCNFHICTGIFQRKVGIDWNSVFFILNHKNKRIKANWCFLRRFCSQNCILQSLIIVIEG